MKGAGVHTYKVEVGENRKSSSCHCCGRESNVGHGFVYKNGDAYAVYYAGWSAEHPERRVSLALAIGEWSDDSSAADRTCFGLEAREGEDEILFRVIEPVESPWSRTELLGEMLSREKALSDALLKEAFVVAEHVVRDHPAISEYLGLSG